MGLVVYCCQDLYSTALDIELPEERLGREIDP